MSWQQGPQGKSSRNQSLLRVDLLLKYLPFTTDDENILTTYFLFSICNDECTVVTRFII